MSVRRWLTSSVAIWSAALVTASCIGEPGEPGAPVVEAALTEPPLSDALWPSTAVGSTQGVAGVTPDGASTYTIPIAVSPGPAGFAPRLAVTYHSRGGPSSVGVGWSISGLSSISRCARNLARDGELAPVRYTDDDALCLDGQRLFGDLSGWRPESGLERIRVVGELSDPSSYFVVELPDGGRRIYGGSGAGFHPTVTFESPIGTPEERGAHTYRWLLAEERDRSGNVIQYEWHTDGEPRLAEARWGQHVDDQDAAPGAGTGNRVARIAFTWHSPLVPHAPVQWENGIALSRSQRLAHVVSYVGSAPQRENIVRKYNFFHRISDSTGRLLLEHVEECDGWDVCLEPVRFDYSGQEVEVNAFESHVVMPRSEAWWQYWGDVIAVTMAPAAIVPIDVNGDGRDDLLYWERNRGTVASHWYVRLALEETGQYGPPIDAGLPETPIGVGLPEVRSIDFDRDGDDDLVFREWNGREHLWHVGLWEWEQSAGSFVRVHDRFDGCEDERNFFVPLHSLVGDFDGNGAVDFAAACLSYEHVEREIDGEVVPVLALSEVDYLMRSHDGQDWWSCGTPQSRLSVDLRGRNHVINGL